MKIFIILVAFGFLLETTDAAVAGISVREQQDPQDKLLESFPIMPGTRWCGNGNISNSEEDLGPSAKTDNCCRAHDMCPDGIAAGKYKHGLHNDGWFTRSHCDCDHAFYKCLKEAGNPLSIVTGTTYFTVLGPQCFDKVPPITDCLKKKLGRCVEYKFDETDKPVWQWMDNPVF